MDKSVTKPPPPPPIPLKSYVGLCHRNSRAQIEESILSLSAKRSRIIVIYFDDVISVQPQLILEIGRLFVVCKPAGGVNGAADVVCVCVGWEQEQEVGIW